MSVSARVARNSITACWVVPAEPDGVGSSGGELARRVADDSHRHRVGAQPDEQRDDFQVADERGDVHMFDRPLSAAAPILQLWRLLKQVNQGEFWHHNCKIGAVRARPG